MCDLIVKNNDVSLSKTLFIWQKQHFLYCEFMKAGYKITYPYKGYNVLLPRIFRFLHFHSFLPFRDWWYKPIQTESIDLVVIREGIVTDNYLTWIRKQLPDVRIVGLFMNTISSTREIRLFQKHGCHPITGDPVDAQKQGIVFEPNGIYPRNLRMTKQKKEYDVCYIGSGKKERNERVKELSYLFRELSLKFYAYITSPYPYGVRLGKYEHKLSYEEVLEITGKAKAILHLSQGASKGITFRVMESVINGIKLITDDLSIYETPVYNNDNIFVIGRDDPRKMLDFINSPFVQVDNKIVESLFMDSFVLHQLGSVQ